MQGLGCTFDYRKVVSRSMSELVAHQMAKSLKNRIVDQFTLQYMFLALDRPLTLTAYKQPKSNKNPYF